MKKTVSIIAMLISPLIWSQVNTETMRKDNQSAGVNHNIALDFSYFSGGSEIIQLMGTYRMDYLLNSNWYGFINGYYNHAFEKDKEDFSNRGFVHFRVAKPITNKIDIEGFVQGETNHFIKLENRELVGGGLRINQFERLFFGVGIMHEMEKYNNHSEEQNFIKSTNYINYKQTIFETIDLQNVIYYQFKMEYPKDLRIFWDGNITAHTINGISFHINIHYQFDNNGKSYFEFSNGLGFQL